MNNYYEKLKGATVLVTGGAGFLGSHICEELLKFGSNVICFDNFSQSTGSNIQFLKSNNQFTFVQGDCNELKDISHVFKFYTIDYVFHHAAVVGVKRTLENPMSVLRDIEGIKHILSLSKEQKIKKVVFASSSEVYGEPIEVPEREDGVINAKLPYAQVKLIGESYCKTYWQVHKLPTTSLRFFNVFGPRQESSDYGFVAGIFMRQVISNLPPTVVDDGSMTRNFVYVKDNVLATIKALVTPESNGEVINIGTGEEISILSLAQKIIDISGKDLSPKHIPLRNAFEILHRNPDISKMSGILKYEPQFSLDAGLKITYEWYKEQHV